MSLELEGKFAIHPKATSRAGLLNILIFFGLNALSYELYFGERGTQFQTWFGKPAI